MAVRPDQRRVGLRDEELLRRFVACRERADGDGARLWWGKLVEANFDRVRDMIDLRARRFGLSYDERQEATQLALVKLWRNMVGTFRGTTMGEWVKATQQLVQFACQETQRQAARRTEHESSFEPSGDPERTNPGWKGDVLAQEQYRREAETGEAEEFADWAIPQIADHRRRLVMERTRAQVPAEDIAAELGVKMDNLYKIRERAVKDMRALWDRWNGA